MILSPQLVTNPGSFVALEEQLMPGVFIIGAIVIAIIFTFVGLHLDPPRPQAVISLVIGGLFLIGGLATGAVDVIAWDSQQAEHRTEYGSAVASWLADGYSIEVSPERAIDLVNGEPFVVEYNRQAVTASIVYTANGDLALVDEAKTPLGPVGGVEDPRFRLRSGSGAML